MFNVSTRIKELRTLRGLTVNRLANLAGISQSYLREIELGNKQPTVEYLEYICDALNVSLVAFFDTQRDDEEIIRLVSQMTEKQKEKLSSFLKTII